jgi:hypothetical protein
MRFRKRILTWAAVFVVLILVYLYVVLELINPVLQQNTNTLAIGQRAIVESLSIPITPPIELDGLSDDQISDLRIEAALQFPWLLYTNYEPSHTVFSQIENGKPWWGIAGQYYYGAGEQSISGLSEESRYILNPYLLVGVDFSGLSIWSGRPADSFWNQTLITNAALESTSFPFYPDPQNLQWWPGRNRVEVTYNLSEFLPRLNLWTARVYTYRDATFDLIAYNARDLNLNYIYVDYDTSIYVTRNPMPPEPVAIPQYLHRGDSCGYSGGCNVMSPDTLEIMNIEIQRLPAKLVVYLWHEQPASQTEKPDLTYVINFK